MAKYGMCPGQGGTEHLWDLLMEKHLIQIKMSIQAELSSYDVITSEYGAGDLADILPLPDNKIGMKMAEHRCKNTTKPLMIQGRLHPSWERMNFFTIL